MRPHAEGDDAWLLAIARHSEVIFDVGSNIGQAALIMLMAPNVKQITLIDPNPSALAQAAENLIRNGLVQKARFACMFADQADDQEMTFWTSGVGSAGSMYNERAHTAAQRGESMKVPTITLDTLADRFGIPDFIKIDVEGAEMRTLEGARRIAQAGKTRFQVEMHMIPNHSMAQHRALAQAWAVSLGYAVYAMRFHKPLSESEIENQRHYLLLQPAGWPYPEWLSAVPYKAGFEAVPLA